MVILVTSTVRSHVRVVVQSWEIYEKTREWKIRAIDFLQRVSCWDRFHSHNNDCFMRFIQLLNLQNWNVSWTSLTLTGSRIIALEWRYENPEKCIRYEIKFHMWLYQHLSCCTPKNPAKRLSKFRIKFCPVGSMYFYSVTILSEDTQWRRTYLLSAKKKKRDQNSKSTLEWATKQLWKFRKVHLYGNQNPSSMILTILTNTPWWESEMHLLQTLTESCLPMQNVLLVRTV